MKDGQLNFTAENGLGVRRSGRARNGDKSKNKGRKVQALSVRKGQTLLELKIQVRRTHFV